MSLPADDRPLVSICIPASRTADGLRAAVQSVLAQDHADLEVVITDDSGGALKPVVDTFADPRVRYHANPKPLGLAGNHTAALARARGRYLGFLHDDDRFLPTYVSSLVACFERDPSLGVVFSDCWIDRGVGAYDRRGLRLEPGKYEYFLPYVIQHDYLIPSTTIIRRDVWDTGLQTWPDLVIGDIAMFVDAALAGWSFFYVSDPLVIYRKHQGQTGAAELRHREDAVVLWDSYRFEDPQVDRLRRKKLAHWCVACAGARLKQGDPTKAQDDLMRAERMEPRVDRLRRLALQLLAKRPTLIPAAHRAWRRLRPVERTAPLEADSR